MSAASVAYRPQNVNPRSVTEDWCKTSAGRRLCCRICAGLIAESCCHVTPAGSVTRTPPCTAARHRDALHGVIGEIVASVEQRHLPAHHQGLVARRDRRAPDDYREIRTRFLMLVSCASTTPTSRARKRVETCSVERPCSVARRRAGKLLGRSLGSGRHVVHGEGATEGEVRESLLPSAPTD